MTGFEVAAESIYARTPIAWAPMIALAILILSGLATEFKRRLSG